MEDVVARDKDGNTIPCLFKSHRASSRKVPSRGLSRSTPVLDLNPMASTLPLRTLPSVSLAESRGHSSRALTDEVRIGGRRQLTLPHIYEKSNQWLFPCPFVLLLGSVGTKGNREDVGRSHTRRGESGSSSWSY
jgi:hypothetical protein